MGMDGSGLSVADALALQDRNGGNDGMFGSGGGGMMMMFLFFILALGGGNGGLLGGGSQAASALTRSDLCEGFNFNNLENGIRGIQNGICDSTYALNTSILNGFHGVDTGLCAGFNNVNNNITQARFDAQQCCCETNRNIDSVRNEISRSTCDIIQAGHSDADRIVNVLTQNTIQELRDQLQAAQLTLGNAAQTNTIISAVRPCPIPAYPTCNPWGCNSGLSNGCGCGGF